MIYRITEEADWKRALIRGNFVSADLEAEGFIHCSDYPQILRTANKYFSTHLALLLLEIDEAPLGTSLVREDLYGSGVFPHVYSPIPLAAVVRHHILQRDVDGNWQLPDDPRA